MPGPLTWGKAMPVRAIHLLTQGKLNSISGGYIYNRELVGALNKQGFSVTVHDISSVTVMQQTLIKLSVGSCVIVDSIIAPAFATAYDSHHQSLRVVYLCHLPLGLRPSLSDAERNQLNALEHKIIECAQLTICTSEFTKNWLSKFNSSTRYLVILPAVNPAFRPLKHKSKSRSVHLLCVANILQSKGQLAVIQALCAIETRSWHLRLVAGQDVCDKDYLTQIHQTIRANKLEDQVQLIFNCVGSELLHAYQHADAFVLATQFETYGMALAEARACALPTIVNDVGGVRESTYLPSTIYVDSESPQDFKHALQLCVTEHKHLQAMRLNTLDDPSQQTGNNDKMLKTNSLNGWDKDIENLCEALLC